MLIDHWDVETLKQRIWENVVPLRDVSKALNLPDHCVIWQGPTSGNKSSTRGYGYGRISYRGKTHAVHRLVYVLYKGPLTPKKQVDHICNNRLCCNPHHLELVTHKENQRRRSKRKKSNAI